MNNLNRTSEWQRLSQAGYFTIDDQPGQISLSRKPPYRIRALVFIGLAPLLIGASSIFGIAGMIPGTLVAVCLLVMGVTIFLHLRKFADRVTFTADAVHFHNGNRYMRYLPREGMQQIAADEDRRGLFIHKFHADTGYISAFVAERRSAHLLMNNILLVAFKQPLHLDLKTAVNAQEAAAFDMPPPDVPGLKAIRD